MAESLTLTVPVTAPAVTKWDIVKVSLDKETPAIAVTMVNNKGEKFFYKSSDDQTLVGLSFINQGKFKVNQGKSLEKWLFDRIKLEFPQFEGTVSGSEF